MPGSLTFLTPLAGLLAVLALVPLAAFALAARRLRRVRSLLALAPPRGTDDRIRLLALVAVPLLLALALTQPSLRRHSSQSLRTDAAVFVVVDTSSSMQAASGPDAPTRLAQAKRIALGIGAQLEGVRLGVSSFTDRVLPNLFPSGSRAAYDSTIRSLAIASPPPRETARVATSFTALGAVAQGNYFTAAEKHRALLLITDGESHPFDAAALARTLAERPAIHVVVVRVGGGGDRLYANGRPAGSYRADPAGAREAVSQLVASAAGRAFGSDASGAAKALRAALGSGPSRRVESESDARSLASLIVLLALVPLLVVVKSSTGILPAERRSA